MKTLKSIIEFLLDICDTMVRGADLTYTILLSSVAVYILMSPQTPSDIRIWGLFGLSTVVSYFIGRILNNNKGTTT